MAHTNAAAGESTIRVAVVDGARAAELRGVDIEIVPLGSGAPGAWRAEVVHADARPVDVPVTHLDCTRLEAATEVTTWISDRISSTGCTAGSARPGRPG